MRLLVFASRNRKELLRDPLNLAFGIGFPLVLLLLLSVIQRNVPVSLFEIEKLAPGIVVFGLSFISLFSGTLIAKDRTTSFLVRLFASPLTGSDFILGYTLPVLPMAILQSAITFGAAFFLGLAVNVNVLIALVVLIPAAVLFIAIGLLAGTVFTDKQVGAVCGALLTNVAAWLSGTWFSLDLVGARSRRLPTCSPSPMPSMQRERPSRETTARSSRLSGG
jgi:ABC-2 type transport system permease protein